MRQIDDPVRLRRRAANLERGPGRRVDPGVLARHIGGNSVCTSSPLRVRPGHHVPEPEDAMGRAARRWQLRRCI